MTDPRELHTAIAALEAAGADRFDPVRFRYIRSLAERAPRQPESVADAIHDKVKTALDAYREDLARAREQAAETMVRIASAAPLQEAAVRALFENHEFTKILRMGRTPGRSRRPAALSELKAQIQRLAPDVSEEDAPFSVDDLLRRQEMDALASMAPADGKGSPPPAPKKELRSLKRIQQTMAKRHSDRLVTRALNDCPENAGPHNAQMLAVTILSTLRQLSPPYLERFLSYMDALLWLKQAGEEMEKTRARKPKTKQV